MKKDDKIIMRSFSIRLKRARECGGFASAAKFAQALGVPAPRYRHWERGTAMPDVLTVTRICSLLRLEANDLLPSLQKMLDGR